MKCLSSLLLVCGLMALAAGQVTINTNITIKGLANADCTGTSCLTENPTNPTDPNNPTPAPFVNPVDPQQPITPPPGPQVIVNPTPTPTPVAPPGCTYGPWKSVSRCSVTCGDGVQTQRRSPTGQAKEGCPVQTRVKRCKLTDCPSPKDCVMSAWGPWSKCSKKCGGGDRYRTRKVIKKAGPGGKPCGPKKQKVHGCNPQPCNSQCKVGPWSKWGKCNASCGEGVQVRTRKVVGKPPVGVACPKLFEKKKCKAPKKCPGKCNYGPWKKGTCSVTCGSGVQVDTRPFLGPANFASFCTATTIKHPCNKGPCNGFRAQFRTNLHFKNGYDKYRLFDYASNQVGQGNAGGYREEWRNFPNMWARFLQSSSKSKKPPTKGLHFYLAAHASIAGGHNKKNMELSRHRGLSAACYMSEWLAQRGVKKYIVSIGYFGARGKESRKGDQQQAADRRVSIFLKESPLKNRFNPIKGLINLQFPAAKANIASHCRSKTRASQSKWAQWLAYSGSATGPAVVPPTPQQTKQQKNKKQQQQQQQKKKQQQQQQQKKKQQQKKQQQQQQQKKQQPQRQKPIGMSQQKFQQQQRQQQLRL